MLWNKCNNYPKSSSFFFPRLDYSPSVKSRDEASSLSPKAAGRRPSSKHRPLVWLRQDPSLRLCRREPILALEQRIPSSMHRRLVWLRQDPSSLKGGDEPLPLTLSNRDEPLLREGEATTLSNRDEPLLREATTSSKRSDDFVKAKRRLRQSEATTSSKRSDDFVKAKRQLRQRETTPLL